MLLTLAILPMLDACTGDSAACGTAACAAPAMADTHATPAGAPNALHWFRNSAERVVIYQQSYAFARRLVADWLRDNKVEDSKKAWGVVVDIDETVLDNSEYQQRLVVTTRPSDAATWAEWANEEKAPAFEPAHDFIKWVHDKGGKIVAVTNRVELLCEAARKNLDADQIATDAVLCAPENTPPEKETRFRAIREGTAVKHLGPGVALYVGDQITDCAGQTQKSYDKEKFGLSCIALPNPMYGTWANNPYRREWVEAGI